MLNITKKRLYKIKKTKNQSKKRAPKRRKRKRKGKQKRKKSFRRGKKSYNLKNKSLKYLKGGANITIYYLTLNDETNEYEIIKTTEKENGSIEKGQVTPLKFNNKSINTLPLLTKFKIIVTSTNGERTHIPFNLDENEKLNIEALQFVYTKHAKLPAINFNKIYENNKNNVKTFQENIIKQLIETHIKALDKFNKDDDNTNYTKVVFKIGDKIEKEKVWIDDDEKELNDLLNNDEFKSNIMSPNIKVNESSEEKELIKKIEALQLKEDQLNKTIKNFTIKDIESTNKIAVANKNSDVDFTKKPIKKHLWIQNMLKGSDWDGNKFKNILNSKKKYITELRSKKISDGKGNQFKWPIGRQQSSVLKKTFNISEPFSILLASKMRELAVKKIKLKGGMGETKEYDDDNDEIDNELAQLLSFAEMIDINDEKNNEDALATKLKMAGPFDSNHKSGLSSPIVLSIYGIQEDDWSRVQREIQKSYSSNSSNLNKFYKDCANIIRGILGLEDTIEEKIDNNKNENPLQPPSDDSVVADDAMQDEESKKKKGKKSIYTRPEIYIEGKLRLDKDTGEPSDYQPDFNIEKFGFHKDAREWLKHVNVNVS